MAGRFIANDIVCHAPAGLLEDAHAFRGFLEPSSQVVTRSALIAAFGDDNTAVLMYDTDTVPVPNTPGAEHLSISDGTITPMTIIFDRAPGRPVADPLRNDMWRVESGVRDGRGYLTCMYLEQFALIVDHYDRSIRFFVDVLGFELVEDSPSLTNDGRLKRWVVVRPPGATSSLLLAKADDERQLGAVGDQFGGRVGLFLRVDDFEAAYGRMRSMGVEFVTEPRQEHYGQVVVFIDVAGNRWDLLGPRPDR